jgi:hypothetical protein
VDTTGEVDDEMTGDETARAPIDLRLVALTDDRSHLVLEDDDSRQFRLPVDTRFAAALRPVTVSRSGQSGESSPTSPSMQTAPHRPGQLEIALESQLTPREIQTRIRAGHSVDEVAAVAGISTDRVERYAVPVIAERGHVVEQAQRAPARRATAGKAPSLTEVVEARLAEQRADADSAEWDAFRADDHRWTVRLSYLAGGRSRVATWSFDPRGRVLAPADDEARWLVDEPGLERVTDEPPAAVRRLTSLPGGAGDQAGDQAGDPAGDPAGDAAGGPVGDDSSPDVVAGRPDEVYDRERDEAQHEPVQQVAAVARSHRRPAVPSWDDIMFGTRRRD